MLLNRVAVLLVVWLVVLTGWLTVLTASATATVESAPRLSASAASAEARATGRRVLVGAEQTPTRTVYANPNGSFTDELKLATDVSPQVDTGAPRTGFLQVLSGHPNQGFWGGSEPQRTLAKVGRCWNGDGECNGIGVGRVYFVFDVRGLLGRRVEIEKAVFNTFLTWTPSCTPTRVEGFGTNPVNSGTTWNNQPGIDGGAANLGWHEASAHNSTCPGHHLGWNATQAVKNGLQFANGFATIMLKAENEADDTAWKKFIVDNQTPNMTVTYNSFPNDPIHLSVENKGCLQAPNEPHVHPPLHNQAPRGPRIWARVSDPDGGLVRAQFEWYVRGGALLGSTTTAQLQSGGYFSIDVPGAHAPDGAKLAFRARGTDDKLVGNWGAWCHVTVDRSAPRNPPAVSSPTFQECLAPHGECPVSGNVGRTGSFALSSGGDPDVVAFRWTLRSHFSGQATVPPGGTATILITPPELGRHDLQVVSIDRAGNVGPERQYGFVVGRGTPPKGHWRLDGTTETRVVDDSPNQHHGVRPPGSSWRSGRHGDALWLDGTGQVDTAGGPAVRTDTSFSVSAWVKLDRLDTTRTAVSQGFLLQYNATTKKWNFTIPADPSGSTRRVAESATPAVAGRWTHLTGRYDVGTKQLQILVDGAPGTSASHPTPWNATGAVQLGRSPNAADHWIGSLDDVQIHDRLLALEEIADLAGTPATEQLFLPFDEAAGATTIDASGNHRIGTLGTAVTRTEGRVGTGALRFDGGTDTLALDGPAVRTDSSFTVTAWVKLAAAGSTSQTVLSQHGAVTSAFRLGYSGATRKWSFELRRTDVTNAEAAVVESTHEASPGAWTHLAGVYDAAAGQIRLFVNTADMGDVPSAGSWNATGGFRVGGVGPGTRPVVPFAGEIDDVHAWTGVRTNDQIEDEALRPVTGRPAVHGRQVARYYNTGGFHLVTTGAVPSGSHFVTGLGFAAPEDAENTHPVYSCRNGAADYFLHTDPACGGHTGLGTIGRFYTAPPANLPSQAVYRCLAPGQGHFASTSDSCEGAPNVLEFRLGYTLAYTNLVRHFSTSNPADHASTTGRLDAHYRPERVLGTLAVTPEPGTTALMRCQRGADLFSSTDPNCENGTVLGRSGYLWTGPLGDGRDVQIFRCRASSGDLFDSTDPSCEGQTRDVSLGFARIDL